MALSQAAPAQELKPWKHGVIEPKGDAGFMWMVGKHDFAAKHGLKLEIVSLKNGAIAHKALLAGELDSVESSPGAAILAGARGADIKILGCDWPGVPHGLMVRPGIDKISDLKGKTVAVAAPGSLPNLLLKAMLEKDNVPESDVHVASLGGDLDRFKAVAPASPTPASSPPNSWPSRPRRSACWCAAARCCRIMCGSVSP